MDLAAYALGKKKTVELSQLYPLGVNHGGNGGEGASPEQRA